MSQTIRLEITPPLAEVILDQPQRRNALSLDMWAMLPGLIEEANAHPDVKVIILHGGGGGVFAAGADISEFPVIYGTETAARHSGATIARALSALENSPKPVIAAIEGACVGGGVSLAVACDLRMANATASFGITPAKLGLVYPPEDMQRLADLVGAATAKRLLYTGRIFSAADALNMRLIDEVVDAPSILTAARELAREICSVSQWSVRATKKMLRGFRNGGGAGSNAAAELFLEGFANPDFAEGVDAFLSKRRPDWKVK